ncbi:phosphodiesterase [Agromyces marinus]|uniref:3',5'-cyclic adenosine monophosphate phosphodiesterase CpdA n=1 Tax=Agromyces marinus TaxID=1389020 RepID=A0ABN6YKU6_9MICO|nr:phosphodiesterase [Agromyces marinus]UIP58870.1 3',5'-cyclic adenosine monophosphate phosphodiesterase CpdA [Agromyces marinus]BDZ56178.1 3',5'-cyclic adenosine monophosphate phosphodiesterase CpdA [Agromyces marinus]
MEHPRLGRYPAARHVIAHLSDTHLLAGDAPLGGRADTVAQLEQAAEQLLRMRGALDAILVSGDIADLGEPDAYRRVRGILDPVAEATGATIVWVMGNHDEREPFRTILLGEEGGSDGPVNHVVDIAGLRIVVVDSSVPGYHHGTLPPETLDWLDEVLAEPARYGTMLAMHHAPIATPLALMDILELRRQDDLAEVLRGRDIRAILGGHLHYPTQGMFAGVPVSVAGALAYTMDLSAPPRCLVGIDGGRSFSLVHCFDDEIVTSVVPVGGFAEITSFGEQFLAEVEALDEEGRLDRWSRKREWITDG